MAIIEAFFQYIDNLFDTTYTGLTSNPSFQSGFWTAIQWAFVFALLFVVFLFVFKVLEYLWAKLKKFVSPTQQPGDMPTKPGPSPLRTSLEFVFAIMIVFAIGYLLFAVAPSLIS